LASEVGSGQVAIFPVFKGFRRTINSEVEGSAKESSTRFSRAFDSAGTKAGSSAGKGFKQSFQSSSQGAAAGAMKQIQSEVASASKALSAARLKEQDAAGKVRVAEAALNDARSKGVAGSARVVAAEEKLATAVRGLSTAQDATKTSSDRLGDAQKRLATTAEDTSTRTKRSFKSMLTGVFDRGGADAGVRGGRAAGDGFRAGVLGSVAGLAGPLAGAVAALGIGSMIVSGIKDSINNASDLQEAGTAISAVFGSADKSIMAFARGAATEIGLSTNAALDASRVFGTFGKSAGLADQELADFSSEFVVLAGDLASFNNTTPEQAIEALGAGLRGESEPLRQYGILLDDATLKARAAELGIYSGNGALTAQQKVLASQAEIMAQTSLQQGDFAKTSGGLANQQRILAAQVENLSTGFGALFLPIVLKVVGALNTKLLPMLQRLPAMFTAVIDLFKTGDFTAGFREAFNVEEDSGLVGFLLRIRDGYTGVRDLVLNGDFTSAFRRAFNVDEDSGVVDFLFRIRDGIRGTVGFVRNAAGGISDGIKLIVGSFTGAGADVDLGGLTNPLIDFGATLRGLYDSIQPVFARIGEVIGPVGAAIAGMALRFAPLLGIGAKLAGAFAPVLAVVARIAPLFLTALNPVGLLIGAFSALFAASPEFRGAIMGLVEGLGSALMPVISQLVSTLGTLMPVFLQVAGVIGTALAQAITALLPAVTAIVSALGPVLTSVLTAVVPIISILGTAIGQVVAAVAPLVVGILGLITPLLQLVGAVLPPLITMFGAVVSVIVGALVPVIQSVVQVLTGLITFVVSIFTGQWGAAWAAIGQIFAGLWNLLVSILTGVIGIIGGAVGAFLGFIAGIWQAAWSGISSFFAGIWRGIVGFVTAYIATMRALIAGVLSFIGGLWRSVWSGISSFFSGIWNGIVGFVRNAAAQITSAVGSFVGTVRDKINEAVGFVRDLPGKAASALGDLGSMLAGKGRALIQGFIDGIKGMIGSVGDAVGGVLDFARGFFPNSPAKRGPFSGAGWRQVQAAGPAIMDAFADGFDGRDVPGLGVTLTGALQAARNVSVGAAAPVAGGAGGDSVVSERPIYADGTLIGWIRELANGEARLVMNQGKREDGLSMWAGAQ
jgi:phage-related protein